MNNYDFKLTPGYCVYNGVAVYRQNGTEITFIIENPEDELLKKRITRAFESFIEYLQTDPTCVKEFFEPISIKFIPGNKSEIKKCISRTFEVKKEKSSDLEKTEGEISEKKDFSAAVFLLDSILTEAKNRNASDIHIENNVIQFRVNGKLEFFMELNEKRSKELISRIKVLGGMNVIECRKCQDGHFLFGDKDKNGIFVRVSSLPVIGNDFSQKNESIVLRLLDKKRVPLELDQLGFNLEQLKKIQELLNLQNGLILVCGATGAGKSTTVAAMLMEIKKIWKNQVKIISLEDPPEYILEGVSQVKIDSKNVNSFSQVLTHIFRQDPDVIMIGEIRDEKSAAAAIRASMTGHLVFATLHTSSAALSFMRLEDLGVDSRIVTSVLKGILLQQINFIGEELFFLADLALPTEKLLNTKVLDKNESELDEMFSHSINSVEVIEQSLNSLNKKKISQMEKLEKKSVKRQKQRFLLLPREIQLEQKEG